MASRQEDSLVNRLSFLSSAALTWSTQLAAVAKDYQSSQKGPRLGWVGHIRSFCHVKRRKERLLAHYPAREKSPQHRKVGEHRVSLRDRDRCPSVACLAVIGPTGCQMWACFCLCNLMLTNPCNPYLDISSRLPQVVTLYGKYPSSG